MQNDRLEYLFLRYYEKTATDKEREELMELVQLEVHQEQLKQLIDRCLRAGQEEHLLPQEIADDILSSIFEAVPGSPAEATPWTEPEERAPVITPFRTWIRVLAAACLVGVMVLAGYRLYDYRPAEISRTRSDRESIPDLPPGKEKARLTLWDGTVIDLESVSSSTLSQYASFQIDTSRGELIWKALPGKTGYNVLTTPLGGQYKVMLPDGSHAWLNAGSSLRFPMAFSENKRLVEMSGEVYFEIHSDKSRPFIVRVADPKAGGDTAEITVLGTHFNVSSYPDESTLRTTLLEGSVAVRKGNAVKVLAPGQQAQIPRSASGAAIQVTTVDTEEVVAWKEGRFEFNGNIKDIMRQIARWYDVEVHYEGEVGGKDFVGAISRKNHISEVLKMLELTGEIRFIIDDHKIIVKDATP